MDKNKIYLPKPKQWQSEEGKNPNVMACSDVQGTSGALKSSLDGMCNDDAVIKVIGAQTGCY